MEEGHNRSVSVLIPSCGGAVRDLCISHWQARNVQIIQQEKFRDDSAKETCALRRLVGEKKNPKGCQEEDKGHLHRPFAEQKENKSDHEFKATALRH